MEHLVEVIGATAFKGTIDGRKYDSGKLFFITRLDIRQNAQEGENLNWKSGHTVDFYKVPNSALAMRVIDMKPTLQKPVTVKIVIERYSNGRESQDVIVDVVPTSVDATTGEIKPASAARSEAEGKRSAQRSVA